MFDDAKAEVAEIRRQRDDARDARDNSLKAIERMDAAIWRVLTNAHNCENAYNGGPDCPGCNAIVGLGDFRPPVPMCKPDPLEDIMPPVPEAEGTGWCC
jgi:hypothetical protein